MFTGYRTYLSAGIVVIHQIAKIAGYDVPEETLSVAIDSLAAIAAIFFRSKAAA